MEATSPISSKKIDPSLQPWYRNRVKELEAEGLSKADAKKQALAEAARAQTGSGAPTEYDWQKKLGDEGEQDWWKDLIWCYENMRREIADDASCPSPGAKGLLAWAKEEQRSFYVEYFKMRQKLTASSDGDVKDDARRSTREITEMLDALLSSGAEESIREPSVSEKDS